MRRRPRPIWAAAAAALATLAGALTGAAQAEPAADGTRTVAYHGYEIQVPAGWRVVELAEDPDACIRFDRPAVYLGKPSAAPDCAADLVGRTAGIVVQPLDKDAAARTSSATARAAAGTATAPKAASYNGNVQVAVEDAGVLVTVAHTAGTEDDVRTVLDSAKLTDGAAPARLAKPKAAPLADNGPQPGDFKGKGFDACTAPSSSAMNAWTGASPYRAVGVYISGGLRACDQPNLTASWVSTQVTRGWRMIPIDVGRQAPCTDYRSKISTDKATAKEQGRSAANSSATVAQGLGIPPGSAIYSDIEGYTPSSSCTAAVLSYLSGWTEALHAKGYLSGFYSSASSGIRDAGNNYGNSAYTRVDHIWFAWWNNAADTNTGSYVSADKWANHQRIHQYAGEVAETWGGVRIGGIDRNYLDVGNGTAPPVTCATANLSFNAYSTLKEGSTGDQVKAAQCLLKAAGHDPLGGKDTPTGTFDAAMTTATKAYQTSKGQTADGVIGKKTWTALLARGSTPTVQNGSTGEAVLRLQRALTAALGRTVGIDGIFGSGTEQAVKDYQSSRGLSADGIVGANTWAALQAGK
ncbi:glycoside hydrolase domain-containing protein [Streptomyces boninensis]|uniref:glycoside hydrolase domain-containing protein n=1 Tax=Streptomyces boninensis TaxID=2039455 RepID=UPI003B216BEF